MEEEEEAPSPNLHLLTGLWPDQHCPLLLWIPHLVIGRLLPFMAVVFLRQCSTRHVG